MPKITICKNCGGKLAASNHSGHCYRNCKPRPAMGSKEEPLPPGVVRKFLIEALCEHFKVEESKLLSTASSRDHGYSRPRHIGYYLLMHDLHLNETDAGKVMGRFHSNGKSVADLVVRDMDDYRFDINAVRDKLEKKLAEKKQSVAA